MYNLWKTNDERNWIYTRKGEDFFDLLLYFYLILVDLSYRIYYNIFKINELVSAGATNSLRDKNKIKEVNIMTNEMKLRKQAIEAEMYDGDMTSWFVCHWAGRVSWTRSSWNHKVLWRTHQRKELGRDWPRLLGLVFWLA